MNHAWQKRFRSLMLPGLKRWIAIIVAGISVIVYGVLVLLGKHPVHYTITALTDVLTIML